MQNIKFLKANLSKAVNAVHGNNEIWFRIYPPPPLSGYFKNDITESEKIKIDKVKEFVLYIHIPFCRNRCDYCGLYGSCDINKIGSSAYIDCLKKELRNILEISPKRKILSILIGGGTPSLIAPADLKEPMDYINKNFVLDKDVQISMEAAPADISEEMAKAIVSAGITRVCLGVQTFNEKKLEYCNRRFQKNSDVYSAVRHLRKEGLENFTFDLIYGLDPKETVNDFLNDNLKHVLKLQPQNIAFYPLQNYKKFPKMVENFSSGNLKEIRRIIDSTLAERRIGQEKNFSKVLMIGKTHYVNVPPYASHYWFLRRRLLEDLLAVGLGGKGEYWINSRFVEKFNKRNKSNLAGYRADIENNHIGYNYLGLSAETSLRKHIIHSFGPDSRHLYESIIRKKFPNYVNLFHNIINDVRGVLTFREGVFSLNDDYERILPFRTKNKEVNYFIFSFCYLYSESDQELLLKNVLKK